MIVPHHVPSTREKLFFFLSGIVISIPFSIFAEAASSQICVGLPLLLAQICSIAILSPFIEEFAKAYPLFYRHGETQRSIFTLGFIAGLGFGVTEFLVYILAGAPIIFRLPGIFFHAAATSITAYGIATRRPQAFYLLAVFLHLANNLLAIIEPSMIIGWILVFVAAYVLSWRLYLKTTNKVIDSKPRDYPVSPR